MSHFKKEALKCVAAVLVPVSIWFLGNRTLGNTALTLEEAQAAVKEADANFSQAVHAGVKAVGEADAATRQKLDAAKDEAYERLREARAIAKQVEASSIWSYLPSNPFARTPEQIAEKEWQEESNRLEAAWREYRRNEPYSQLSLRSFIAAETTDPKIWKLESKAVNTRRWREWNARHGYP